MGPAGTCAEVAARSALRDALQWALGAVLSVPGASIRPKVLFRVARTGSPMCYSGCCADLARCCLGCCRLGCCSWCWPRVFTGCFGFQYFRGRPSCAISLCSREP